MFGRDRNAGADTAMLRCSFCNKTQNDVRKLIAGPKVYICDECVRVCLEIMEEDVQAAAEGQAPAEGSPQRDARDNGTGVGLVVWCSLCRLPTTTSSALLVENRGVLCSACVAAVQSAATEDAERDA